MADCKGGRIMDKSKVYSDLALEAAQLCGGVNKEIPGVSMKEELTAEGKIKISQVVIHNEEGAERIGRPIGHYFTIESQIIREGSLSDDNADTVLRVVAAIIKELIPIRDNLKSILVAGLGNMDATPDAVGPLAVQRLEITRYIQEQGIQVSAIVPGVMGQTGMETSEILKGIVEQTKPQALIVIDALAARSVTRLGNTIQISDTGIQPGSGVGNHRNALTEESMGLPVLSVGAPTVVGAVSLVCETVETLTAILEKEMPGDYLEAFGRYLDEAERYGVVKELLEEKASPMYITPKDIDSIVQRLGYLIGEGINRIK